MRPSLIDSTAALFAAKFGAAKAAATSMTEEWAARMNREQSGLSEVQRAPVVHPGPAESVLDDPRAMQELVDKVVERIENKVVDELERRGRRHNPGVF